MRVGESSNCLSWNSLAPVRLVCNAGIVGRQEPLNRIFTGDAMGTIRDQPRGEAL